MCIYLDSGKGLPRNGGHKQQIVWSVSRGAQASLSGRPMRVSNAVARFRELINDDAGAPLLSHFERCWSPLSRVDQRRCWSPLLKVARFRELINDDLILKDARAPLLGTPFPELKSQLDEPATSSHARLAVSEDVTYECEEYPSEENCSECQIRGWRVVSAAELLGKGSPERDVFSQTPV